MHLFKKALTIVRRTALLILVTGMTAVAASSQEFHLHLKGKVIQAIAMGTSTQLGKIINVNIYVYGVSTATERAALVESFTAGKSEGLSNALSKMKSKGRIAITGTVGYTIAYVREIPNKDGTYTIRMVTDRPVTLGENWYSTRSADYDLTALELTFTKEGKAVGKGVLLPACYFRIDKKKQLVIETRQNPWDLTHVKIR